MCKRFHALALPKGFNHVWNDVMKKSATENTTASRKAGPSAPDDEAGVPGYRSPHEYAAHTGLSIATVRRYLKLGRLPKHQPGGPRCRVLIPMSAVEALDVAPVPIPVHIPANEAPPNVPPRPRLAGKLPNWLSSKA